MSCDALHNLSQFPLRIHNSTREVACADHLSQISDWKREVERACPIPVSNQEGRNQYFVSLENLVKQAEDALARKIKGEDPASQTCEACVVIIARYLGCSTY